MTLSLSTAPPATKPCVPNGPAQLPGRPRNQYTTSSCHAGPVRCSAWILMKALVCEDGDGTQPPPPHLSQRRPSPCVPSNHHPTPDSTPASTCTPGPSSSSSSTTAAKPASPKTCPPTPTPSSTPSPPSATASSSPAR